MKKLGFVIPWFGFDIPGGAEAELRELVIHLHRSGVELEVLTTCVKQFTADWNTDFYKPGVVTDHDITIRRFKVRKRDDGAFNKVNIKLMNNLIPLTAAEEQTFVREMVNSPDLIEYMREHKDEYSLFIFIPYMFGTTYYGCMAVPEKAVLIPCFHDESYFYMKVFREQFSKIAGMIFHAKPEQELTNKFYDMSKVKQATLGEIVIDVSGDAEAFRRKYGINEPFILYAGRKDAGKNVDTLVRYFREYKLRRETDLKLVLIGGGEIDIPKDIADQVRDLGFVDLQDKYDAYAAAAVLCQPSKHESFSLVIMESWLCRRPVIVSADCAVTKNFAIESEGGLYFKDYFEFEGCVDFYLNNPELADRMGINGREYVTSNFLWETIVERYMKFFKETAGEE